MALTVISLKWVHREIHGKPPSPRQGHTACVIGDIAYIFGGIRSVDWPKKGTYFFRDLHQLHLYKRMQWEKVKQKGDIPKGRYGHHMCVVGQKIYLFGGKHELQADQCLQGVHVFDTESRTWSDLLTSGTEPLAHSSACAMVGKRIYVFGGLVKGQAVDDLFCFDTESRWWVKLTVTGVPPSPRCDAACTAVGNKLYFFGGTGGPDSWFNDLHVFDIDKLLWTEMNRVEGDPPSPRGNHTFLAHADKDIYIFGGTNDSNTSQPTYGDLYKFSLDKHKWKRPFYGGCPPARRSGHTAVAHKNKLIIIGGSNEDTDFNDVHLAKLINPSKRQPLKVSANDMHEFLSGMNSPEPSANKPPPSTDPSDGHFHEKPEPTPCELASTMSPESSTSALMMDNEGSIASVGSSLSQGKSVHFEDEDGEEEEPHSARSSASSSSTTSSAASLSSQASSSTASSSSSDATTDLSEGSPVSNNNNNNNANNNSNNAGVAPVLRAFQPEENEKQSVDEGLRHGVDKEVQVTGLDTSADGADGRASSPTAKYASRTGGSMSPVIGADIPGQFGMQQQQPPMQQIPEGMANQTYPMSAYQQQQQQLGPGGAGGVGGFPQQQLGGGGGGFPQQQLGGFPQQQLGGGGGGGYPGQQLDQRSGAWHPPPLNRGSTLSDFRFMQGHQQQQQMQPLALPVQSRPVDDEEDEEEDEESESESGSESDGDDASTIEAERRSNSVQETDDESDDESDSDEEDDEEEEDEDDDDDEEEEDEEEDDSADESGSDSSGDSD